MLKSVDTRLAQQAYEQLLEMVVSGELEPGSLLNERRLAETLEMSRTPVRDALLLLEGEGLLVRQGSRTLQVRHIRVEDVMDTLQIRLLLEPEAARRAAGRVRPEALRALETALQDLLTGSAAPGGVPERATVRAVDDGLHDLIVEAAGNAQMAAIIQTLRRQTQMFDLKSLPQRLQDTCREHLAIAAAVAAGDGAAAAQAMRQHLEAVRESIIAHLTRLK